MPPWELLRQPQVWSDWAEVGLRAEQEAEHWRAQEVQQASNR